MDEAHGFAARAAFFFISTALISGTALADSAAAVFGARKHVIEPQLALNGEPELCERVLADAKAEFDSTTIEFNVAASSSPSLSPLSWRPAFDDMPEGSSFIGRLDLDLGNTGRKQVVIYRDAVFNWQGDWHYAYVFPDAAAFEAVSATVRETWVKIPGDQQYPDPATPLLGATQYYPSARTTADSTLDTGNAWAGHELFRWGGGYYFFGGLNDFDLASYPPVVVYRLWDDGHVAAACRIDIPNGQKAHQDFASLPAVASFLKVLRTIGAGGTDCGTLRAGERHDYQATAAERRAAIRPWAVSPVRLDGALGQFVYYEYNERTERFLDEWGLMEQWNRREHQTFLQHVKPAQEAIAAYLVTQFGLAPESAKARALEVIHELIGARLLIPQSFEADGEPGDYLASDAFNHALLSRDRQAFDAALERLRGQDDARALEEVLSRVLANAVEWPWALDQLLRAGADPNAPNDFGKTPLMVAAHMNRVDSVRRLLAAGANVHAAAPADKIYACAERLQIRRTVLAYAAENASPVLMKVIVDAGASIPESESEQREFSAFLAKNPRLSSAERELGVRGLSANAQRFAGPSFNCIQARSATEKAICNSEVLRIFDAELARAYGELRSRQPGSSLVAEQRKWLRDRDTVCRGRSGVDDECLAEKMRTRIRYLHNRLNEGN
jgi:uncharacterized protein YecT (DUF1311 family)